MRIFLFAPFFINLSVVYVFSNYLKSLISFSKSLSRHIVSDYFITNQHFSGCFLLCHGKHFIGRFKDNLYLLLLV